MQQVIIESIDIEGKGVARIDGKTVFVAGALPQEKVDIEIYRSKPNFDMARLLNIIEPSIDRVEPRCPHYGVCGGCSLQHLEHNAQIKYKQQALIDNLKHIGKCEPLVVLEPISDKQWGYRNRARMSARFVIKKGGALVGFHEKSSSFVADMHECHILAPYISQLIPKLRELIGTLLIKEHIPQIEVAVGENINVLVFRIMQPLEGADQQKLKEFVDANSVKDNQLQIWLQTKGLDTVTPFYPLDAPQLNYTLPKFDITMPFLPTEFTQVNPKINQKMVTQALEMLNPKSDELIYDFFCGIGNFTLPIAKRSSQVVGFEGNQQLVERAFANASLNNVETNVKFEVANLFKIDASWLDGKVRADKWLIDPPRDGAMELINSITANNKPKEIVYVSCNPATLARDSMVLVHTHGYKLAQAGVINMFPNTSHIESIAHFILG